MLFTEHLYIEVVLLITISILIELQYDEIYRSILG